MFSLDALFGHVDDFCQSFEPFWQQKLLEHGGSKRVRAKSLCLSEMMTILIAFHQNYYRNFKHFYLSQVQQHWRAAFPKLPSYHRFVKWMPSTLIALCAYLKHCCGSCTGIGFVDSTSLRVCHNRRIGRHRVFKGLAARGKTSVDCFFGVKVHLVVNELGELLNVAVTPGNMDSPSSTKSHAGSI